MEPVSDMIFSLFRGTPQHGEWLLACLRGAWPGIVGDRIARVCSPAACNGPALVVAIHDAAWESVLQTMRPEVLAKIRSASRGEIRGLSFTLGPPLL
jgi:hypothetical protein